jgi:hypothetical protein
MFCLQIESGFSFSRSILQWTLSHIQLQDNDPKIKCNGYRICSPNEEISWNWNFWILALLRVLRLNNFSFTFALRFCYFESRFRYILNELQCQKNRSPNVSISTQPDSLLRHQKAWIYMKKFFRFSASISNFMISIFGVAPNLKTLSLISQAALSAFNLREEISSSVDEEVTR